MSLTDGTAKVNCSRTDSSVYVLSNTADVEVGLLAIGLYDSLMYLVVLNSQMSKSAPSDLSRINLLDTPDVSFSDDYLIC